MYARAMKYHLAVETDDYGVKVFEGDTIEEVVGKVRLYNKKRAAEGKKPGIILQGVLIV